MEKQIKKVLKSFKVNENLISTIMGGVVLVLMGVMIFNYFKSINKTGVITEDAAVKVEDQVKEEGKVPANLPGTYTVAKGDDLWHISEKVYGSGYNYVDIAKENKMSNPSAIEVGVVLQLPKVETKVATSTKPMIKAETKADSYTVVKGDHLWKVALTQYGDGYAWTRIYEANKKVIGVNPSTIEVGMKLTIPR